MARRRHCATPASRRAPGTRRRPLPRRGERRRPRRERHVPGGRGKAIPARPPRRQHGETPGAAAPSTRTATDQAARTPTRPAPDRWQRRASPGGRAPPHCPRTPTRTNWHRPSATVPAGAHEAEKPTETTRRAGRPAPHHVLAFARAAEPTAAATPHGPEAGVRTATAQRLRPTPAASQQPDRADSGAPRRGHAPESSRRDGSPVLLSHHRTCGSRIRRFTELISTVAKSA